MKLTVLTCSMFIALQIVSACSKYLVLVLVDLRLLVFGHVLSVIIEELVKRHAVLSTKRPSYKDPF